MNTLRWEEEIYVDQEEESEIKTHTEKEESEIVYSFIFVWLTNTMRCLSSLY
jgi:hypothetical protein